MSRFAELWRQLLPIGRCEATGGYRRFSWTDADAACRAWFTGTAADLGLDVETDRNGNLWAWWGTPGPGAVVTGSHLDSVPDGGAFDGPLGVVSALAAVAALRERGWRAARPLAVVCFVEEEGARFGMPCLGSRLMTGAIDPAAARALRDRDGVTWAEAAAAAGLDAAGLGPDPERVARIGAFVELHVEQGRRLADLDAPVGVASAIWPHGRWRLEFRGRSDHAGTTRLADRRDPMLAFARTVLATREEAADAGALATIGRVTAEPGGTNVIASLVRAWLDCRAPDDATLAAVVDRITALATGHGERDGVAVTVARESSTPEVRFAADLRDTLATVTGRDGVPAPVLPTGAGHDAGVLAAAVPTGMLFVRNPSGVSHAPGEHADRDDCEAGVVALTAVLAHLAGGAA